MLYDDDKAQMYIKTKQLPLTEPVENYAFFDMIGDLVGKSVLELGCGGGYYTRQIKQKGAEQVVGVDISDHMIEFAKQEEAKKPIGIEYVVHDVCELGKLGSFDLVTSPFLLNHSFDNE